MRLHFYGGDVESECLLDAIEVADGYEEAESVKEEGKDGEVEEDGGEVDEWISKGLAKLFAALGEEPEDGEVEGHYEPIAVANGVVPAGCQNIDGECGECQ